MKDTFAKGLPYMLVVLLIMNAPHVLSQETEIKVTSIRSAKGKLVISVFKDNASFDKEQAYKKFSFDKKALANGVLTVNITIDPGVYGLALLDDENDNGKMDNNFIRMPKEGFGFSNFYLQKLKKPVFDDFKVVIKPGLNKVEMKVKYL